MDGISVIIPTLNRTEFVLHTLDDLMHQDFAGNYEVLVVDQSDREDEAIKAFAATAAHPVRYFHVTTFRGLPEARNFGWQHARYERLVYLDDDVELSPRLLSEHYKSLGLEQVGAVAGGITEKHNANPDVRRPGHFNPWTCQGTRGYNMPHHEYVDHAPGGNFSVFRRVAEAVGGVDERLNVGAALYEETDFCLRIKRAGYKIFFNYDAHLTHLAAPSGGCRVPDIRKYIRSLVHNRSLLIHRHLRPYQRPTATLVLLKQVLAYSVAYRRNLFPLFLHAWREGKADGRQKPRCGDYRKQ